MQEPDTWLFIEAGFGICMRWSTLVVLFNFNFFFCGWVRESAWDSVALLIEDSLVL